eukprot:6173351-Pleurochrysis_carterae.AAC.3
MPVDVFGALVVLRVLRQVEGALVVHGERHRVLLRQSQLAEEGTQVYGLFGRLGGGDGAGGAVVYEDPAEGRVAGRPV